MPKKLNFPMLDGEPQPGTIEVSELNEVWHRNNISSFQREIYPIYQSAGFTLPEAMTIVLLNDLRCNLEAIQTILADDGF